MMETRNTVRNLKASRSRCLVVTCIPCDTPFHDKESPNGCISCGMLDWFAAFESEKECNRAYKKQHPVQFDVNGNYIGDK